MENQSTSINLLLPRFSKKMNLLIQIKKVLLGIILPLYLLGLSCSTDLAANQEEVQQVEKEVIHQLKVQQFQHQAPSSRMELSKQLKDASIPLLLLFQLSANSAIESSFNKFNWKLPLDWEIVLWHSFSKIQDSLYPFHFFS